MARNVGYNGARNEVGMPRMGSYSFTVERSKCTKEASWFKSCCAYQRNPLPAEMLRANISYWNMSSSPIPNPRAARKGIRRNSRATIKIRNANDLNMNFKHEHGLR